MIWIVAVLALLAISLTLQLGNLLFVAYAVLGILLLSRYLTAQWTTSLQAKRHANQLHLEQHQKMAVVVELTNQGRWRILWTLVEDLLPRRALLFTPPALEVVGERIKLVALRAGESMRLIYQLIAHRRGYYQIGPLVAETGDLFGLHRRYRVLSEPSFLTVYPEVVPLSGYEIGSPKPLGEIRFAPRLYEDPTRQAGVRAYAAGDPLRRIHWRASARTGTLQSKVYEPSSIAGATILLDFHQESYPARDEPHRSELAIVVANSLAFALYELSQQVGLISNGRDAADRIRQEGWEHDLRTRAAALAAAAPREDDNRLAPQIIPAQRGAQQPLRIRELLARLEKTDGFRLHELIQETTNRLARDASVIAVVGRLTATDTLALTQLKRQGFSVTAIINVFEPVVYADLAGPLIAAGIPTQQLVDHQSISQIARRSVTWSRV